MKKKIMIAEDEAIIAFDLMKYLQQHSYQISSVISNGEKVIEEIRNKHTDLIIMDIILDGRKNGVEIAKIAKDKYNIPVIYLTGISIEHQSKLGINNYDALISKPFEGKELLSALEHAFKN